MKLDLKLAANSGCVPGACWLLSLLLFTLGAGVTGCDRRPPPPRGGPTEMQTIERLPAEFYGTWKFQESSGGIDGRGNAGYRVDKLVIREPNIVEEHHPGGSVTRHTFTAGRGKSIFSTEDVWQIQRKQSPMREVVRLDTNGILTISENVYDGFSYSFKRE